MKRADNNRIFGEEDVSLTDKGYFDEDIKSDIQPDGKKRKIAKKKGFREALLKILSLSVTKETVSDTVLKSSLGKDITYGEAIILAQIIKASFGDTQAAAFIRDTSGNSPKENAQSVKTKKFEDL